MIVDGFGAFKALKLLQDLISVKPSSSKMQLQLLESSYLYQVAGFLCFKPVCSF
jgi:hypothetical protein